jgi:uncharacterized membrane protein HdeD (DUF308 family)
MIILARNWWALAVRGILGIGLGVLTFVSPGAILATLVLVFGAYALIDGVFSVLAARRGARGDRSWWALLLGGVAGVLTGLAAFLFPAATALLLLYLIAGWAVVTGALEIAAAIRLRRMLSREWLLALDGVVSILFGVLIMIAPAVGALAVVLLIGAYAFVSGVVLLALAFRLRAQIRPGSGAVRRAA